MGGSGFYLESNWKSCCNIYDRYCSYSVLNLGIIIINILAEGVVYYNPDNVLTPVSLPDIQDAIRSARKNGRRVRVLGSGHSWSPNSLSEDLYLSLDQYRGLVSIDKEQRLATFRGGTKLWEINQVLDQHGLALSILPSISNQTIAGAIATGSCHEKIQPQLYCYLCIHIHGN